MTLYVSLLLPWLASARDVSIMYLRGPWTGGVATLVISEKVASSGLDPGAVIGEVSVITGVTTGC